ncbi:DUF3784 domain-containing protein [Rossellomorea vietnamensis]|uniref:DUF3784 domain-containing protein n=2 Tax=Rossellomorea TaxID=2837508 RepID=A0A5D4KIQ3_9BACI|nr:MULTISPECIES: DUF3784 domain-containing protein [Rossellomorea]TYR76153.1 DUF3784 domain-containing protein [Rossellomorea vietnamensis]TYS74074.1 DUF3784 domain-containing protein [Rossellomorea aquimaris]
MIVHLLIIGLFVILGIFLINGKGAFLIAGYNTLPKEEKEKYDTEALCKFMGKMMFALSFSISLWALSEALDMQWLFIAGMVLFMALIFFMLVYINTGSRFKKGDG